MCGRDKFDQVFWAEKPADPPASGVEVFAGGADGEGYVCDRRGEGADSSEGDVVEAVVDLTIGNLESVRESELGRKEHVDKHYFVREDDDVIFYAEVPDCLELILGEYFSYRIVPVSVSLCYSQLESASYGVLRT